MQTPMPCYMPAAATPKAGQINMKKIITPSPAPAPLPTGKTARPRTSRKIGAKTLITLSAIAITMGGWAFLAVEASATQAQAQVDSQEVASVGPAQSQSEPAVLLDPLPTVAPLEKLSVNANAAAQPVPVAPQPAAVAAAPLPKPRKIHVRAVTRSSR